MDVPEGITHREDEVCPFANDNLPKGMFANCCWLRGKAAAYELDALGEHELCNAMYSDMTCDEAVAFAEKLRVAVGVLEAKHRKGKAKPEGYTWGDGTSTFEEALDSIREAARWYDKVGSLGFGVHAWY